MLAVTWMHFFHDCQNAFISEQKIVGVSLIGIFILFFLLSYL